MDTHHGWDPLGCRGKTWDVKVRKCEAPSDWEDSEHLNKKLGQASNVCQWLKATEDRKRRAQFYDEKIDTEVCPVKKFCLLLSADCAGTEYGQSDAGSPCNISLLRHVFVISISIR